MYCVFGFLNVGIAWCIASVKTLLTILLLPKSERYFCIVCIYRVSGLEIYKNTFLYLVPKSFMQFMFSTVYRVIQKDFYARPYTLMWAEMIPHFWMRLFLDVGSEEEVILPDPLDLRI